VTPPENEMAPQGAGPGNEGAAPEGDGRKHSPIAGLSADEQAYFLRPAESPAHIAYAAHLLHRKGIEDARDVTGILASFPVCEDFDRADLLVLVDEVMRGIPPVLNPSDQVEMARTFVRRVRPNLRRYREEFFDYRGGAYRAVDEETVQAEVTRFLDWAKKPGKAGPEPFRPTSKHVTSMLQMLGSVTILPPEADPPFWIGEGPDPRGLIVVENGILRGRELLPHDPRLFTLNVLPIAHDPGATCPTWLRFLAEVFAGEQDQVAALQEWCGYLLTPDASLQKAVLLVGPPRSGKGTILRACTALVGEANTGATDLPSLVHPFGLQHLIGKLFAPIPEGVLGVRTDADAVLGRLKSLIGGDPLLVHRKFLGAVSMPLPARVMIAANEEPRLRDASGAWASRLILLKTRVSFLGKEDPALSDRILAEGPGILNWALDGLDRIKARGRIAEPASTAEEKAILSEDSSTVEAFVREMCVLSGEEGWRQAQTGEWYGAHRLAEPRTWEERDTLAAAYRHWMGEDPRRRDQHAASKFSAELRAAFPRVREARIRVKYTARRILWHTVDRPERFETHETPGETRAKVFQGIRLQEPWQPPSEDGPFA
jgi:putative DNA primase/helicase